ncbi:hypothetical protein HDU67_002290 [Dinochytrium kinnereticum]|nr:hypothetical protein HDU67_002290 [Dinochytrium kinnereticum]
MRALDVEDDEEQRLGRRRSGRRSGGGRSVNGSVRSSNQVMVELSDTGKEEAEDEDDEDENDSFEEDEEQEDMEKAMSDFSDDDSEDQIHRSRPQQTTSRITRTNNVSTPSPSARKRLNSNGSPELTSYSPNPRKTVPSKAHPKSLSQRQERHFQLPDTTFSILRRCLGSRIAHLSLVLGRAMAIELQNEVPYLSGQETPVDEVGRWADRDLVILKNVRAQLKSRGHSGDGVAMKCILACAKAVDCLEELKGFILSGSRASQCMSLVQTLRKFVDASAHAMMLNSSGDEAAIECMDSGSEWITRYGLEGLATSCLGDFTKGHPVFGGESPPRLEYSYTILGVRNMVLSQGAKGAQFLRERYSDAEGVESSILEFFELVLNQAVRRMEIEARSEFT